MAISSKGIRTPDDTTLYDPPVDLAAMAASIDPLINFRRGSTSQMTAVAAQEGERWYNTSDNREYVRRGTAWVKTPVLAAGVVAIPGGANVVRSVDVSFPPGLFSSTPVIGLAVNSGAPKSVTGVSFGGASAAGVTVKLEYATATTINVHWTATEV